MSLNSFVKLFNVNYVPIRKYTICQALGLGFRAQGKGLHVTNSSHLPQAALLQLPNNVIDINSAETGRFSPLRERDISGPVINAHDVKSTEFACIDITVDVSDPHVGSYDCHGAVNLSSSMQSNVPRPFSGTNSHLGMPGSQWGQGYKYLSEHLHGSHYLTLRNKYREMQAMKDNLVLSSDRRMSSQAKENSTEAKESKVQEKDNVAVASLKYKLKKAVKEYGSTVIVFHVTISLASLGTCYLLVSSGLDIPAMLTYFNIGEGYLSKTVASNAGTFVVAYAVHKVFAPARLAITLTATPFIVRHLRKIGFLKPPSIDRDNKK